MSVSVTVAIEKVYTDTVCMYIAPCELLVSKYSALVLYVCVCVCVRARMCVCARALEHIHSVSSSEVVELTKTGISCSLIFLCVSISCDFFKFTVCASVHAGCN